MQPTTEERYIEGLAAAAPPRTDWPPEPQHDDYPPHDNDYDDERRYIRRDLLPHRGSLILTLGIISIAGGTIGAVVCGIFSGLIGIGLGITAVVMGRGDLRQIDTGSMDPDGRGHTKAGVICGFVGIGLGVLVLLFCGAYLAFILYISLNQK
jgi:hypothetical protein